MRDTILVVEDDHDLATALNELLTDEGYRVIVTDSAAEAQRYLRAFRVQLVFTDALWQDRAADPWAAVEAIRAVAGSAPIVLCSGHDMGLFADLPAHGCTAFLAKPFDLAELTALARRLLPAQSVASPQSHGHEVEQLV